MLITLRWQCCRPPHVALVFRFLQENLNVHCLVLSVMICWLSDQFQVNNDTRCSTWWIILRVNKIVVHDESHVVWHTCTCSNTGKSGKALWSSMPPITCHFRFGRTIRFVQCDVTQTHYNHVIMTMIASKISSLTVVYSIVYSGADQRKHQSSASLAFVRGIHRDRWIPRTKGQ